MTYMFSKGGAETTKLMNVVNLPMQNSTVVRKMTQPAASRPRLNSEDGKGTKASDVPLLVRHALSSVDGLNIRLKDKEKEKLGVPINEASQGIPVEKAGHDSDDVSRGDDRQGAAAAAASSTAEPPAKKARKQEKKNLFKGYDEEKATYQTVVYAISRPSSSAGNGNAISSANKADSRPITALDDCIAACRFILDKLVSKGSVTSAEEPGVLASFSFCIGLFFEFAWTGKVSVNGKHFRQYSVLRTELQQCFLDAHELLSKPSAAVEPENPSSGEVSKTSKGKRTNVGSLELAELLCTSFHSQPVTSVAWSADEPGESTVRSILTVMTEHSEDIDKMKTFVRDTLSLPLVMHPAVQKALTDIAGLPSDSTASLTDIISIAYDAIIKNFPDLWTTFGFDCVSAHADQGQFVEDTAEVFHDVEKLQQFASIRLRYLLAILKETLNMGSKPLKQLSSSAQDCMRQICDVSPKTDEFDRMFVFDSMQFTKLWSAEWARLLNTCNRGHKVFISTLAEEIKGDGTQLPATDLRENTNVTPGTLRKLDHQGDQGAIRDSATQPRMTCMKA